MARGVVDGDARSQHIPRDPREAGEPDHTVELIIGWVSRPMLALLGDQIVSKEVAFDCSGASENRMTVAIRESALRVRIRLKLIVQH